MDILNSAAVDNVIAFLEGRLQNRVTGNALALFVLTE
jgi:hypothetical protein